ncbi:hypothetical protein DUNSADRAFT_14688 [Dunaliella salina]|uniref:Encoded protein n=1 Tax=Dunaliella salina TaxID=3046 RepID=A0ABQ7G6W7_DUNSA|nr:hypothetical protein DUNSADRAFT_14688 [Dunaliella salina]|eukprot:KAF5830361.1 hypothetical protein DUNSADRAFT_14688 [Dunaliella salina]
MALLAPSDSLTMILVNKDITQKFLDKKLYIGVLYYHYNHPGVRDLGVRHSPLLAVLADKSYITTKFMLDLMGALYEPWPDQYLLPDLQMFYETDQFLSPDLLLQTQHKISPVDGSLYDTRMNFLHLCAVCDVTYVPLFSLFYNTLRRMVFAEYGDEGSALVDAVINGSAMFLINRAGRSKFYGVTPLHLAHGLGNTALTLFLLNLPGMNTYARDEDGRMPHESFFYPFATPECLEM